MAYTAVIREIPSQDYQDIKMGQATTDMQNGAIVDLGALVTGKRDVHVATAGETYIVTGVELMYDTCTKKNLVDYINEANKPFRCERLVPGSVWAVSKTGLYESATAAVGAAVGVGSGKFTFGSGTVGKVIDVYVRNGVTFYAIEIL